MKRLTIAIAVLFATSPSFAQERVGQITALAGSVKIERHATGEVDEARQIGPRVRNGSVFGHDILRTGPGASATLVFTDASRVVLEADTSITVREADLSAVIGTAGVAKPMGRTIKILAGNVLADIVANPEVATEFETPTGVAAVKGTSFRLGVAGDGSESLSTSEGEVRFAQRGTGLELRVAAGNQVGVAKTDDDAGISVTFPDSNAGGVDVALATGEIVEATPGTGVQTRSSGFAAQLRVDRGGLTRSDGAVVKGGGGFGFANSDFQLPPGTPVTLRTDRGSVEFLNASAGVRAQVEAGFGIGMSGGGDSQLRIVMPASNPGTMPFQVGRRSVKMKPQTDLGLSNGRDSLDIDVDEGELTMTDDAGTETTVGAGESLNVGGTEGDEDSEGTTDVGGSEAGEDEDEEGDEEGDEEDETAGSSLDDEEDSFVTLNCGECGIQVGDACQDDDSLCVQDCYADRRCQGGRCTGGRRLTSLEDPNCQ